MRWLSWLRYCSVKPGELSSSPRTHRVERKNQCLKVLTVAYTGAPTPKINTIVKAVNSEETVYVMYVVLSFLFRVGWGIDLILKQLDNGWTSHCGFHNLKRSLQTLFCFLFFSVYVQLAQTSNRFFMCSSNVITPLINLDERYWLTMCLIV